MAQDNASDQGRDWPSTKMAQLTQSTKNTTTPARPLFFQTGVHAIEMACEYATQQACPLVTILSDSQAAILALTSPYITSRTVLRTLHALTSERPTTVLTE
jgi:hypothetical protein